VVSMCPVLPRVDAVVAMGKWQVVEPSGLGPRERGQPLERGIGSHVDRLLLS